MKLSALLSGGRPVIADGAMGTYFSELTGLDAGRCETANLTHPDVIRRIHQEYIRAGAQLIRTNTFSANSFSLHISRPELKRLLTAAWNSAAESAGSTTVICADVSAIYDMDITPEEQLAEYRFIIDTFLACGAEVFLFETLPDLRPVLPALQYLHQTAPHAEAAVSFTVLPDGRTRSGLSVAQLAESIVENRSLLTMAGLNCGCGALQMMPAAASFLTALQKQSDLFTSVMPNAGYPSIENRRTVFTAAPDYFALQTARLASLEVSVIGGCCGTTPLFIERLARKLSEGIPEGPAPVIPDKKTAQQGAFSSRLAQNDFTIAVELDPPVSSDMTKLISAARKLKENGVSVITISDSPLGHARMDSVLCSARIQRETGIEALPHLCCRDKNLNALRSVLLGAHSEGIRAVLAVTGDPIAETDRGVIKPVFNVDSTRLMELISTLNRDLFAEAPIVIGGAYDPAPRRMTYSLERAGKKQRSGASFVLTQPVFSEECIESIDRARAKGLRVLAGIMPLVSYRNACFMKNEVPGVNIPDEMISRFRPDMTREEAAAVGVELAAELARRLRPHADGFYFITPFNRAEIICDILHRLHDILPR